MQIRQFYVLAVLAVVQRRQRNVQKNVMHVQNLLFCLSKPIAFLPFSLLSPSLLRKLPNILPHMLAKALSSLLLLTFSFLVKQRNSKTASLKNSTM